MAAAARGDPIHVLVVGGSGVGKTTLIMAHINDCFPLETVDVHRVVELPPSESIPRPMIIEDSHCSLADDEGALRKALDGKDAVLLLYAVNDPASFAALQSYWLPILESITIGAAERNIPVLLIGTKADLVEETRPRQDREQFLERTQPLLTRFQCLEMAMECSAKNMIQSLHSAFVYAFKMVEYPVPPLYDVHARTVTPGFEKAVKRIFRLCDEDRDNLLNEHELTEFQEKCFGVRLGKEETKEVFEVLRAEAQKGVTDRGITEFAFKKLLLMFITQSRPDSTWTVLRYFHYNQDLELEIPEDVLDVTHLPDQIVELNDTGVRFLIDIFEQFSVNNVLPVRDVEYIFSIAPSGSHPFGPQFPFNTHCNKEGALTCGGWLSAWSMLLTLDTRKALENLYILGALEPTSLTQLSSTRQRVASVIGRSSRRSLRCLVVGSAGCGKSSLVHGFLRRVWTEPYEATLAPRHSVAPLDGDTSMIFTEVPARGSLRAVRESFPSIDVICLCYQAGSRESFAFMQSLMDVVPTNVPVAVVETQSELRSAKESSLLRDAAAYCDSIEISAPYRTNATQSAAECYKLSQLLKQLTESPEVGFPITEAVREANARAIRKKVVLGVLVAAGAIAAIVGFRVLRRRR